MRVLLDVRAGLVDSGSMASAIVFLAWDPDIGDERDALRIDAAADAEHAAKIFGEARYADDDFPAVRRVLVRAAEAEEVERFDVRAEQAVAFHATRV